jgi:hypothetical protein
MNHNLCRCMQVRIGKARESGDITLENPFASQLGCSYYAVINNIRISHGYNDK